MNIIPISNENFDEHIREKKEENVVISLPQDWWSVDISLYSIKKNTSVIANITPIKRYTPYGDLKVSHRKWNRANGDYRVREPYRKDYAYYRDLKNKLVKYSVYPFVFLVSTIIYFISILLSNI